MILRLIAVALISVAVSQGRAIAQAVDDDDLAAAAKLVEKSDRYLHHSKLKRGMKGYGLTVMAGTEIVKFDVEIVSVVKNWSPHQDMVLANLAKQNLEHSGVIAGMSGSPVFIHCEDGKDRMIGAVAFGWNAQKDPLCGIQPITQMLAISGVIDGKLPTTAPAAGTAAGDGAAKVAASAVSKAEVARFMENLSAGRKADYSARFLGKGAIGDKSADGSPKSAASLRDGPRLTPLATPLMVSGVSKRTFEQMDAMLRPLGIIPMQGGAVGGVDAKELGKVKLEPGSSVSLAMVSGDADLNGIGTVTEVIGDKVLIFGHELFGEGETEVPMGTGYVHTVVAGLMESFKLGSVLDVTGTLVADEKVGGKGIVGQKPKTIPMTVNVEWKDTGRKQSYNYTVFKHRRLTPVAIRMMIADSTAGWHDLPEHHIIRHTVNVEFDKLGSFSATNVTSGDEVYAVISDVTLPITAMMRNPFGPPPDIKKVTVDVTIESGSINASIEDLRLDGAVYKPGETVTGQVVVQPYRKERTTIPVGIELPADLPDGDYVLTACDNEVATSQLRREMPQLFAPRSVKELFETVKLVSGGTFCNLYLRLPLRRGGVSVNKTDLPDLPASKTNVLSPDVSLDSYPYIESVVACQKSVFVLSGSAVAKFQVRKDYDGSVVHGGKRTTSQPTTGKTD